MLAKMDEKMGRKKKEMDDKMDSRNKTMDERMYARDEKMNAKMDVRDAKIDKQKDDIITSLTEKFQTDIQANKNEITGIKEQMKDIETNLKVMQNGVLYAIAFS